MKQEHHLAGVVRIVWQWRRALISVSIASGVLTAVISLLLPNYYMAETLFLAANPNQARPEILFGKGNLGTEIYGGGDDMDRILSIAESSALVDFLVDSFDLYRHYRIDPSHPRSLHRVRMKFHSLYTVKKTKLDAIELEVEDRSPELAAAIANAARERINYLSEQIVKGNQQIILESYRRNLLVKKAQIEALTDSVAQMRRKFGIYNLGEQSRKFSEQIVTSEAVLDQLSGRLDQMRKNPRISRDTLAYTEAYAAGLQREVDSLRVRFKRFSDAQLALTTIETQYFAANGQYGDDVERTRLLESAFQSSVPALFVVEKAEAPKVKSRPKRSIIVVSAVIGAFLLSILAVLLLESYRGFDWEAFFKSDR
jgi:tyrosine-protein kinase Etk/Wzc